MFKHMTRSVAMLTAHCKNYKRQERLKTKSVRSPNRRLMQLKRQTKSNLPKYFTSLGKCARFQNWSTLEGIH